MGEILSPTRHGDRLNQTKAGLSAAFLSMKKLTVATNHLSRAWTLLTTGVSALDAEVLGSLIAASVYLVPSR
jgi:hypothetical protein